MAAIPICSDFVGFPGGSGGEGSFFLQCGRPGFHPWVRKFPWGGKWQPTPVFLPGKSHGWWSLAGYNPWGHKESDTTLFSVMSRCKHRDVYQIERVRIHKQSQIHFLLVCDKN